MHNVRTSKPPRHASAKARDKRLPPVPPGASSPFLLASAPPGFPRDVAVPPHRGALIELAATPDRSHRARKEYLVTAAPRQAPVDKAPGQTPAAEAPSAAPARKPRKSRAAAPKVAEDGTTTPRKKKAASRRKKGATTRVAAAKAGAAAQPVPAALAARPTASRRPRKAVPQGPGSPPAAVNDIGPATGPLTVPVTVTVTMPDVELIVARLASTLAPTGECPAPEALAPVVLPAPAAAEPATRLDPAPAALAPAAATSIPRAPLARDRALVRTSSGLVARVVAWLGRLVPRQRRAALPRVRTRITSPAAAPRTADPLESDLARRMLLQLSEENDRLRGELDRMQAAAARLPRA